MEMLQLGGCALGGSLLLSMRRYRLSAGSSKVGQMLLDFVTFGAVFGVVTVAAIDTVLIEL